MLHEYLACDLGAESGRLMLGRLNHGRLSLEEVHRFSNTPIRKRGSLLWDIPKLFSELLTGLKKAAAFKSPIASISCDSWGLDYVLLDTKGRLIEPTYHYRDQRCMAGTKKVLEKVPWETVFGETGIQFMNINTLFQLGAEDPARLAKADKLLLIADAFHFLLSGQAKAERSLASTSQLYNPSARDWSSLLLNELNLRPTLFPEIVPPGTVLGTLLPKLAKQTGLPEIKVVATCSHDTGAAVAAVPATGKNWAYLSSGTWSLMGVERAEPIINFHSRQLNFTNEIGYGDTVRLLKNIVGLWIVQECRRYWAARGEDYDYAMLTHFASTSPGFVSLINPADPRFVTPDDMPEKIAAYCQETEQPVPQTPGAVTRCVLESLALQYRRTLGQLEQLTGEKIERLHIVGGGSQNSVLNHYTANALQIPVVIGPVEATALGNVMLQAIALGHLPSLEAGRKCIQSSFPVTTIQPTNKDAWNQAYKRFEQLK